MNTTDGDFPYFCKGNTEKPRKCDQEFSDDSLKFQTIDLAVSFFGKEKRGIFVRF